MNTINKRKDVSNQRMFTEKDKHKIYIYTEIVDLFPELPVMELS